ncbi:hypothetical protein OC835_003358 [Tilletia horrida]|nr:hypothetical protein OC835_003358 [Tilletia horrida]
MLRHVQAHSTWPRLNLDEAGSISSFSSFSSFSREGHVLSADNFLWSGAQASDTHGSSLDIIPDSPGTQGSALKMAVLHSALRSPFEKDIERCSPNQILPLDIASTATCTEGLTADQGDPSAFSVLLDLALPVPSSDSSALLPSPELLPAQDHSQASPAGSRTSSRRQRSSTTKSLQSLLPVTTPNRLVLQRRTKVKNYHGRVRDQRRVLDAVTGHLLAQFSKIFRDSTLAAAAQITASMLDVDESDIKSARASKGSVKAITSASEPQESSNERKRKSKVALRRREVRDMVILRQMAADALRARADPDSAASEMSPTGSSPRLSLLATPPPSHGSPELSPSMHSQYLPSPAGSTQANPTSCPQREQEEVQANPALIRAALLRHRREWGLLRQCEERLRSSLAFPGGAGEGDSDVSPSVASSPSTKCSTTLVLAKLLDIMDQEVNQQA